MPNLRTLSARSHHTVRVCECAFPHGTLPDQAFFPRRAFLAAGFFVCALPPAAFFCFMADTALNVMGLTAGTICGLLNRCSSMHSGLHK